MRLLSLTASTAGLLILSLAPSIAAESVLMPAKGETCKNLPAQSEAVGWRCPGPAGFSLVYSGGEGESGIGFGRTNQEKELTTDSSWSGTTIDAIGVRAEWRMSNGIPFAAIVARWRAAGEGANNSGHLEYLVVKVTDRGSCAIATFGALEVSALNKARKLADDRGPLFRCGIDKPSLAADDNGSNVGRLDGHFASSELLDHNGSIVELTRSERGLIEIRYKEPRRGLPIQPNTVLFSGQEIGGALSGTAYVFKANCEGAGYPVTGKRQNGVLILEGAAPRRDKSSCRVSSASTDSKHARLEFNFDPLLNGGFENEMASPAVSRAEAASVTNTRADLAMSGAPSARPSDRDGPFVDWKNGKLGRLSSFAGTYTYDAVLDDAEVKRALKELAGEEQVKKLRAYMSGMSPIGLIGADLVLTGDAEHQGGVKEATVWISIHDGSVRAALLDAGTVTVFARDAKYEYLPEEFRNIVRRFSASAHGIVAMEDRPPQGATWVR
ncbi:hypothetical protein IVB45_08000 [Bradyrhizobium sp. 4]|uniref:hypothetical protein n=1 Tax=unclassified Bradyrhizobium TaxID=2631580 RepID=UPI001FFC160F|nr:MULTISPECIES: hypothetical protein [unclassified Bradyrhizobium]MCK1397411.1 hypothetical protein [Bradyrhizobium sp. 39]MCK1752550.1 hypothetical protein [Bradyrhizobium sp. 135]UPJ36767.1 hypothetical protein IVB45_08000 [Bradyrhizobium sp. 4]